MNVVTLHVNLYLVYYYYSNEKKSGDLALTYSGRTWLKHILDLLLVESTH